jgi:hypothetical protein
VEKAAHLYEVSFVSALWMVFPESWKRIAADFYAHDCSGGRVDNVDEIWPVVCGGYYYGEYFDECIVIGKPELETRLLHARHSIYKLRQ